MTRLNLAAFDDFALADCDAAADSVGGALMKGVIVVAVVAAAFDAPSMS